MITTEIFKVVVASVVVIVVRIRKIYLSMFWGYYQFALFLR